MELKDTHFFNFKDNEIFWKSLIEITSNNATLIISNVSVINCIFVNGIIQAFNENIVNFKMNKFLIKSIHSELLNNDLFTIESKKIFFTLNNFHLSNWKSKNNS